MNNTDDQNLSKKDRKQLQKAAVQRTKTLNQLKIFLVFFGALALLIFWFLQTRVPVSQSNINKLPGEIVASDHVKGLRDSKIIVMEYADFQCPACAAYSPLVQELAQIYGDQVAFVYRHFPLKQIHFQAELAAQASEAAAKQDKFWEMYSLLYVNQLDWSEKRNAKDVFIGYAKDLGLNTSQFTKDLESDAVKAKVKEDYLNALSLNLNGTPTFFVNGQKIDNPSNLETFKNILNQAGAISPQTATGSSKLQPSTVATPSAKPQR